MKQFVSPEQQYGASLESLLERRERVAKSEGAGYGSSKVFDELAQRLLSEVQPDSRILEIDAGAGLFTKLFLARGCTVTAVEPVQLLARRIEEINSDKLTVHCGFVEDLTYDDDDPRISTMPPIVRKDYEESLTEGYVAKSPGNKNDMDNPLGVQATGDEIELNITQPEYAAPFDYAFVTFPARRGRGILALVCELLPLVKHKVLLVLQDDGSVDWTSTMRAVTLKGYSAKSEFVVDVGAIESAQEESCGNVDLGKIKRTMLMTIDATPVVEKPLCPSKVINAWGAIIRVIEVPYPVPRGAATRLIRYFKAGGDRSILIKTEHEGMHHLYGNLRTAVHRIAREDVTVRRVDNGIQLMQVPKSEGTVTGV